MLWCLGSLLVPLGFYALAGFYLTPYLLRAQVLPRVSASLNAQLSAEAVEFDPFALRLVVKGFSLKDKAGQEMVGLGELDADMSGTGSIGQRAAVLDLKWVAPTIHVVRKPDGKLNLLELVPPDDGRPSSGGMFPFLLTRLVLEQGRIEYQDASGKQPFTVDLDAIGLELHNLGSVADSQANFEFTAQTPKRETVSIDGKLALVPFATEGKLRVQGLELAAWVGGFAPESPWRVKSGKLGVQAEYRIAAGDKLALDLHSGAVTSENLEAAAVGNGGPSVKIAKLSLGGIGYASADQRLAVDAVGLENAASTWANVAHFQAGKLAFTLADQRLALESLGFSDASTPQGIKLAKFTANKLALAVPDQTLNLDTATLENADTPWAKVASLSAAALSYAGQGVKLTSLELHEVVADREVAGDVWREVAQETAAKPTGTATRQPKPEVKDASKASAPVTANREIPRRARIGTLKLANVSAALDRHTIDIGGITLDQGELGLRRTASGDLKIPGLPLPAPAADAPGGEAQAPGQDAAWVVRAGDFQLRDYTLGFRDEVPAIPVRIRLAPANLHVEGFSTEPGKQFKFLLNTGLGEQGKIEFDGQAKLFPLQSEMRFGVDKLWLRSVQPYWEKLVGFNLTRGRLNLWGDLVVRQGKDISVDYSGAFDIVDLAAVDKRENQDLLRWRSLKFDGVVVGTDKRRASIRSITADQSYSRVFIGADGVLNLTRDLVAPGPEAARTEPSKPESKPKPESPPKPAKPTAADAPWSFLIGSVRVADAHMDFSDFTLMPNFATEIRDLNGNIRGLSSQENAKAEWLLEGHINQSAPVKIYGQLQPARFNDNTDVTLEFRGVNLTTLSPYSGKFAGYRIERGKLDLDLRYKLKQSKLEASNRIVLDQLVLGERVESPTATTLPVDLAVALLKDSEGRIDIDLPVSGDLDDPRFSLGGLLSTALRQMFTKLLSSPFALLGNLVGGGDESLSSVRFRAGDAELSADEKAELDKVAAALKERPTIKLNIKGGADPVQDRMALADAALLKQLRNDRAAELRALGQRVAQTDGMALSDEDYRRLFARFYRQRQAPVPAVVAPPSGKEPSLEGATFDAAKRRVLEQWNVGELELRLLAQARAEAIRGYLVDEGGLQDKRIYLLDAHLNTPEEKEIKALLSLSGS